MDLIAKRRLLCAVFTNRGYCQRRRSLFEMVSRTHEGFLLCFGMCVLNFDKLLREFPFLPWNVRLGDCCCSVEHLWGRLGRLSRRKLIDDIHDEYLCCVWPMKGQQWQLVSGMIYRNDTGGHIWRNNCCLYSQAASIDWQFYSSDKVRVFFVWPRFGYFVCLI